ncbi:thiamine-phosphate diphosphorylase [Filimonas lacunae]|uniref:Thiamine-phosphate synthase n=1 Tax=Filimonas lacunae TaxID=477680 RepID=A0A173MP62_9BACT|nr:thiamine phosphate synthase [Filimonas lacunae]BAV09181.1 thiamin-phosphate pyrophosphorylase [Filimonas lacunae]SIS68534.1 thiamine-phosphate diphosphorylase [Filimonas lacunae]
MSIHTATTPVIHPLHYISQEQAGLSHTTAIHQALDAGCRWIQLRVKEKTIQEITTLATQTQKLCKQYQAVFILNDYPAIARETGAHGVHLGLTDMPVAEARIIAGPHCIIGGTANTFAHIQQRTQEGCDYIGLGPFRFTTTKQKLSPVLGLQGYAAIVLQAHQQQLALPPVIAIGGITPEDVPGLMQTGVKGIALSGAITHAADRTQVVTYLHTLLNSQ